MLVDWITLIPAGFSLGCGGMLLSAYAWSELFPKKTTYSTGAAAGFTLILASLQWQHIQFVFGRANPLESGWYLVPLFLGPCGFFLFGRAAVMPDAPVRVGLAVHFLPLLLPIFVIVSALAVLAFGVSLRWVDPIYFVAVYASSVGATYAMITFALVAEALEVNPHQLSELINTQLGIGFSRYVRSKRLTAACELLKTKPKQSVLSIALEVGFRSQSTFYAAFKAEFQKSPGEYRSAQTSAGKKS